MTPLATRQQYVDYLSPWEQNIIHDLEMNILDIWESLIQPNAIWTIASDGSYTGTKAAYAWILHTPTKQQYAGTGPITGNPLSAFRAKLFGMCAWYCVVTHVIAYLQLENTIQICPFTDNTKVIHYHHHIISEKLLQTPYQDNYNLFTMIKHYHHKVCLLYTSPSPRDGATSRMPSSA